MRYYDNEHIRSIDKYGCVGDIGFMDICSNEETMIKIDPCYFRECINNCTGKCMKIGDAMSCPLAKDTMRKYNELIMAVAKKYSGESRHDTALRYIRQAELPDTNVPLAHVSLYGENSKSSET